MNKTILTGAIIVLVAVIGVMAFTGGGEDNNVTNEVSTTSDETNQLNNSANTTRNWKVFGPSSEFSREFTFQIPQNWESFIGPGNAETASVDFVLASKADFEGNFPAPGDAIAQAELALQGESLIDRFQDDSRVTQGNSEPVTIDEYEGSVYEWTIQDGELTTQLDGYLAEGETSRKFKILHLPDIGNGEEFTLLLDSDTADIDQLFITIIESADFQ